MTTGRLAAGMVLSILVTQDPAPRLDTAAPPLEASAGEGAWTRYRYADTDFTFEYPAEWQPRKGGGSNAAHLSHPELRAHVVAAAFRMSEGSLEEFARLKLGAQSEVFDPSGPFRKVEGPGWNGLIQETDDARPDRGENTRRVVLFANHGDLYVSLSLYVDPQEFVPRQKYYERLFTSVRFER